MRISKEKILLIATAILIPGGTIFAAIYLLGKKVKAKELKNDKDENGDGSIQRQI